MRAESAWVSARFGTAAPEESVRRWQDRLTPAWKWIGGGCHLNRAIAALIEAAGFHIDHLETGYMKGPKPLTFMYGAGRVRSGIGRADADRQR